VSQWVRLIGPSQRALAKRLIDAAPLNAVVKISEEKRSLEANAAMWASLSDISRAKPEGRQWPPETWKSAFLHFLGHQVQFCEGLDGSGPFPLGFRSSQLTKKQMSDLLDVIHEYGARHGVQFSNEAARYEDLQH